MKPISEWFDWSSRSYVKTKRASEVIRSDMVAAAEMSARLVSTVQNALEESVRFERRWRTEREAILSRLSALESRKPPGLESTEYAHERLGEVEGRLETVERAVKGSGQDNTLREDWDHAMRLIGQIQSELQQIRKGLGGKAERPFVYDPKRRRPRRS